MHQVFLLNLVASLNHIGQHSFTDNGYMSDALLNIPTGGRVEAVDKQLACVLFAMPYLTIVTRKSPEKRTPKHKALNLICLGLFICCILSMLSVA